MNPAARRATAGTRNPSAVPLPISRPFGAFLTARATGSLPEVSFVDPRFIDEQSGTSNDEHPHADIRNGEAFLNLVYSAVALSPAWRNTVLIINFDEWGGFFEHVAPSAAPIPLADQAAGNQDGLRGSRVPCLIVSPFARRGFVSSTVFDHTSVLRLIEWRWPGTVDRARRHCGEHGRRARLQRARSATAALPGASGSVWRGVSSGCRPHVDLDER